MCGKSQTGMNLNSDKNTETQSFASLHDFLTEINENCLLLARHGETDWNALNIIQGQEDRPLSLKGFEQRKSLFYLLNPVALNRIICSTLQRTIQTAAPICIEKNIPLEKIAELNEVKLGIYEGQHKENFSDDLSKKCYQKFLNDEVNVILPGGGESLVMADKRIQPFIAELKNSIPRAGHALLVGHRNVNKMIIKNLLNLSLEQGYQVEHKNAWLYVFAPQKAEIILIKVPALQEPVYVQTGIEKITDTAS